MNHKQCDECGKPNSKINSVHKIRLCHECIKLDEYKMICKTDAKLEYFLTDKDLLQCDSVSGSSDSVLYKKMDIVDVFCIKYVVNPFDEACITSTQNMLSEKRKQAKEIRRTNAESRHSRRKQKLIKALNKSGLELRSDSKLCQGYINGTIKNKSVDECVLRMCQMKYLYDYCRMEKCYKRAVRKQNIEWEAGYIPDIPLWDQAEMIALDKYGPYPREWPWLK